MTPEKKALFNVDGNKDYTQRGFELKEDQSSLKKKKTGVMTSPRIRQSVKNIHRKKEIDEKIYI